MLRKMVNLCVMIAITAGFCGCWDARNIEDSDICTAVVVDHNDGEYAFYVEVAAITSKIQSQSEQGGGSQGMETNVVKGYGSDFSEARVDLDRALNKPIYLGAVQSLIITRRMADSGIEEYLYRVREMNEYRKTMDVIITDEEPEILLGIRPENASTIGFAIQESMQSLKDQGMAIHVSLADVLQRMASHNRSYLLATLGLRNGEIVLTGYTIFDGSKPIGFIPYDQSRGVLYASVIAEKHKPQFNYTVSLENGDYTLVAILKSLDVKAGWDGSRPTFDVKADFDAKMLYGSTQKPLTSEIRELIRKDVACQLMYDVAKAIGTSQEYECDYLLFSEPFRIAFPGLYKELNWNSAFKNAQFNIQTTVILQKHPAYNYNPIKEN